jgi:hypothetical protein
MKLAPNCESARADNSDKNNRTEYIGAGFHLPTRILFHGVCEFQLFFFETVGGLLNPFSISQELRWISYVDRPWLKILHGNGSSAKYRSFADPHTRPNERLCGNPCKRPDLDRLCDQLEIWVIDVMRPTAEMRALGNNGITPH